MKKIYDFNFGRIDILMIITPFVLIKILTSTRGNLYSIINDNFIAIIGVASIIIVLFLILLSYIFKHRKYEIMIIMMRLFLVIFSILPFIQILNNLQIDKQIFSKAVIIKKYKIRNNQKIEISFSDNGYFSSTIIVPKEFIECNIESNKDAIFYYQKGLLKISILHKIKCIDN